MIKKKGFCLVPTGKQKFGLFYCDGEKFQKLYSNSYKQLEWNDYFDWLERAQQAKKQWLNEEISDDEFLNIVHELD